MVKQIKPLDQQIEEYKNQPAFTLLKQLYDYKTNSYNWVTRWNWDNNWDGQLIRDVIALEQAGFTIVSFNRKRKVTLLNNFDKYSVETRGNLVKMISNAVGDSWYSISFKPTLSIYWKGRSSSWNY